jgi:hypothetical protein
VAAPATNPGIVHPVSERSAARMCFTARIYCPRGPSPSVARPMDEHFVASHGHVP